MMTTTFETIDKMNTNFVTLSDHELMETEGGVEPTTLYLIYKGTKILVGGLAAGGFLSGLAKAFN